MSDTIINVPPAMIGPHGCVRVFQDDGSVIDCVLFCPWPQFIEHYLASGVALVLGLAIERAHIVKMVHLMPGQPIPMAPVATRDTLN